MGSRLEIGDTDGVGASEDLGWTVLGFDFGGSERRDWSVAPNVVAVVGGLFPAHISPNYPGPVTGDVGSGD